MHLTSREKCSLKDKQTNLVVPGVDVAMEDGKLLGISLLFGRKRT